MSTNNSSVTEDYFERPTQPDRLQGAACTALTTSSETLDSKRSSAWLSANFPWRGAATPCFGAIKVKSSPIAAEETEHVLFPQKRSKHDKSTSRKHGGSLVFVHARNNSASVFRSGTSHHSSEASAAPRVTRENRNRRCAAQKQKEIGKREEKSDYEEVQKVITLGRIQCQQSQWKSRR